MFRLGYQLYDWVGLTPQEIQALAKAKNMSFDVDSFEKIVESAQLKKRREISAGLATNSFFYAIWPPLQLQITLISKAQFQFNLFIGSRTPSVVKKWSGTKLRC